MGRLSYGCTRQPRTRSFARNRSVFWADNQKQNETGWASDDVILVCKDGRSCVNSCFAPKDIFKAISDWSLEQKKLIVEIGLGGILEIDNILFVNRDFPQWLLQRVDSRKSLLKIGQNECVQLSELRVSSILGIRYGGCTEIPRSELPPSLEQIILCRSYLGIGGSTCEITVSELLDVLMKKVGSPISESEKRRVQVGFVMLCCTVFFSPRNKRYVVPRDGYEMVKDPDMLGKINFGKYIIGEIINGAAVVQNAIEKERKRFNVHGCLLLLQILYFDSVETGFFRVEPTAIPRIAFYTGAALMVLIDEDTLIVDEQKIYGTMPAKNIDGGNSRYKGHLIYDEVHDWLKIKNEEFCQMLADKRAMFCAIDLSGDFNKALENEANADELRKLVINYKKDLKDYIYSMVVFHKENLLKTILYDLGALLAGVEQSTYVENGDKRYVPANVECPTQKFAECSSRSLGMGATGCDINLCKNQARRELGKAVEEGGDRELKRQMEEESYGSCDEVIVYDPANKGKRSRIEQSTDDDDYDVEYVEKNIYRKCILQIQVPLSPFDTDHQYPVFDSENAELGYQNLIDSSLSMKNRVWLVHHVPVILRMKGRHIFEFVGPDGEANYVDVELFTRVMIQIESKWTNPHGNVRWRHPMNASFAGSILHSIAPWDNPTVNKMFVGSHIPYDVESCRMLLAPYQETERNWVLYVFDMWLKKLHVLDPVRSCEGVEVVKEHHVEKCKKLLDGTAKCFDQFFDGLTINTKEWKFEYHGNLNEKSSRENSGFYVLHYMISFDGVSVKDVICGEDIHRVKKTILQLIACMENNSATFPRCIYQAK